MALQGDLRDFSITEIVQLIGQQFKTGVLNVQHGRKKVEIYFVDGTIEARAVGGHFDRVVHRHL